MVVLDMLLAHSAAVAVLLAAVCVGLLAWIVVLLRAEARRPVVVRARAVVRASAPPPAGQPDRPLINPKFAEHIAAESARFAAAARAGRLPRPVVVNAAQHLADERQRAGGPVPLVRAGEAPR